jgi:hypothetical protein
MKKRMIALLMALLMLVSSTVMSFAQVPTALEAPQNAVARINDDNQILLRFKIPQSILALAEDNDGEIFYVVDWKKNNGPWHFDGAINETVLGLAEQNNAYGYVGNAKIDVDNVTELFFVYWHLGEATDFDFVNNSYSFRVRFAFAPYDSSSENFIVSPFSNETTVGKGADVEVPKTLEAPANLKVELKKNSSGRPYFHLTWSNPASVSKVNEKLPIVFKIDFKVGNEKWFSETTSHAWWGGYLFDSKIDFDPIEKDMVDKIVIEENTYYFRILYAYEPTDGTPVYSSFSNTVSIGMTASEWAKAELQEAFDNGLVPDILKGKDLTKPITREEFAELAVLLYEKATGKIAEPVSPNPLNDTNNPQILKAYALGITKGTKVGTSNIPFEPNTLINREQVATMLFRTIKLISPDSDFSIAGVKDFPDQKDISDFAVEATKFMFKLGIIKGDSRGYFMPKATTSAQEAAGYGMASREAAIIMASRTYNVYK